MIFGERATFFDVTFHVKVVALHICYGMCYVTLRYDICYVTKAVTPCLRTKQRCRDSSSEHSSYLYLHHCHDVHHH